MVIRVIVTLLLLTFLGSTPEHEYKLLPFCYNLQMHLHHYITIEYKDKIVYCCTRCGWEKVEVITHTAP
jgi:hypothetical protein